MTTKVHGTLRSVPCAQASPLSLVIASLVTASFFLCPVAMANASFNGEVGAILVTALFFSNFSQCFSSSADYDDAPRFIVVVFRDLGTNLSELFLLGGAIAPFFCFRGVPPFDWQTILQVRWNPILGGWDTSWRHVIIYQQRILAVCRSCWRGCFRHPRVDRVGQNALRDPGCSIITAIQLLTAIILDLLIALIIIFGLLIRILVRIIVLILLLVFFLLLLISLHFRAVEIEVASAITTISISTIILFRPLDAIFFYQVLF
mmetsp:Transcript_16162/g.35165  ORF Transcript_16162/g.35165 Transcript_16162/m.35165 type:complete len:261 (-) Transcript_16162:368-1150(-)